MNTYLYARSVDGDAPEIRKVVAKGYNECLDKIMQHYINSLDDLGDTGEDFEDFCEVLAKDYDINIGEVVELEQFS